MPRETHVLMLASGEMDQSGTHSVEAAAAVLDVILRLENRTTLSIFSPKVVITMELHAECVNLVRRTKPIIDEVQRALHKDERREETSEMGTDDCVITLYKIVLRICLCNKQIT